MGMIIRFTFVEGIILKNYRINLMLKILKSSYLNLNIYTGFQLIWIVMLLDGDSNTKLLQLDSSQNHF
jgi:hypothetical protein